MEPLYDLLGIGIGPFNLSLAALIKGMTGIKALFIEKGDEFHWHRELMFEDSTMQTCFLKDLVTPVDPTCPYSFMNYLVRNGLYYPFLNTNRKTITRFEFQDYCRWVSSQLDQSLLFNTEVTNIRLQNDLFVIETREKIFYARNICLGSGPVKYIPEAALPFLGRNVFHAKSQEMISADMKGKRVVIVGGGQTGLEIFRNILREKWGRPESVHLLTRRPTLQPLDEAPFTNEFFTPGFVDEFFSAPPDSKEGLMDSQKLSSDGNTPEYLKELYQELYLDRFYFKKFPPSSIRPLRRLETIEKGPEDYRLVAQNLLYHRKETLESEMIILATGFKTIIPPFLRELYPHFLLDSRERPLLNRNYSFQTDSTITNKIYAMNFGRHIHGIADPQTSLMAWRSAVIINDLTGKDSYPIHPYQDNFCRYQKI